MDNKSNPSEYKVIEAGTAKYLESAIEKLMSEGWKLLGGVAIRYEPPETIRSTGLTYSQAMTR